jgi:hypothetical protein
VHNYRKQLCTYEWKRWFKNMRPYGFRGLVFFSDTIEKCCYFCFYPKGFYYDLNIVFPSFIFGFFWIFFLCGLHPHLHTYEFIYVNTHRTHAIELWFLVMFISNLFRYVISSILHVHCACIVLCRQTIIIGLYCQCHPVDDKLGIQGSPYFLLDPNGIYTSSTIYRYIYIAKTVLVYF